MRALKDIKKLVYPNNEIDWIEVLKETILLTVGENKLVKFSTKKGGCNTKRIYLDDVHDCLYGVAVIGDKVFAITDDGDGYYVKFGTAWFGSYSSHTVGIGLEIGNIIKACQLLIEGKYMPAFDFETMSALHDYPYNEWYDEYFLKGLNCEKDEYDSFVRGEACGYISIT